LITHVLSDFDSPRFFLARVFVLLATLELDSIKTILLKNPLHGGREDRCGKIPE